jgi:hypothetical protein
VTCTSIPGPRPEPGPVAAADQGSDSDAVHDHERIPGPAPGADRERGYRRGPQLGRPGPGRGHGPGLAGLPGALAGYPVRDRARIRPAGPGLLRFCLTAARWGPRRLRPVWLAIACGADFGVTAFLLKITPDTLAQGFGDPLRQWPLYLLVVVGPLGFLLNQSAFQAGLLIAPVLAIITALDPLVSISIARVWLDESFASSPPDLAAEALSLAVMTGGIVALAHRAPQIARDEVPDSGDDRRRPEVPNTIF